MMTTKGGRELLLCLSTLGLLFIGFVLGYDTGSPEREVVGPNVVTDLVGLLFIFALSATAIVCNVKED
uniref:Uncharacterized protein n=1 Tax=viral metagenome TaxID=1070528 RepID=A0A6M3K7C6_9ZZZZ